MLKNIDPVLNADVLHALCSMGHGDEIVIVDAHYAAQKTANHTGYGKLLRMEGVDTARAVKAVLSVMDIDPAVGEAVERMKVDDMEPSFQPNCQKETQKIIDGAIGREYDVPALLRPLFYERAKNAFAIVITGETRAWGCYILRKGLNVTPDLPAGERNATLEQYDWETELGRPEAKR
jgi:L-fucose mutarotase